MFYEYGDNPYGEVGDYSKDGDKGLQHAQSGYGGYGRRRRGRRHGRRSYRGHGGRGGSGYSSGGKDWNTYVSEIFDMSGTKSSSASTTKVSNFTKKSELNEAYRKRAQKRQVINMKA